MIEHEYFIEFDTKIHPGKLEATRVTLGVETISDLDRRLPVDLCNHPLYSRLETYVKANPSKR